MPSATLDWEGFRNGYAHGLQDGADSLGQRVACWGLKRSGTGWDLSRGSQTCWDGVHVADDMAVAVKANAHVYVSNLYGGGKLEGCLVKSSSESA